MEDSGNSKITFSSMGGDFIDARFDPEHKKVFQEKLDAFDAESTGGRSQEVIVRFFGNFDEKSKRAIQVLVNECLKNARRFNLTLKHTLPEVHFFTPLGWSSKKGPTSKRKLVLPASRISWIGGSPYIELIIPEKVKSTEEVIKTVRLFCSKLFGKLFFDEHVPYKSSFRNLPTEVDENDFNFQEKIHFCRFVNHFSLKGVEGFERMAKMYGVHGAKAEEVGKKEFFKSLTVEEQKRDRRNVVLLEENFREHLHLTRNNPEGIYDLIVERVFTVAPQTSLLLPHELKNFQYLREQRQWLLFHALEERLKMVVNLYNELLECKEFLENVSASNPMDTQISFLWKKSLKERIHSLKKRSLIKEFLMDNATLTAGQKRKRSSFPLWIWQNNLLASYPKNIKAEKIIQRITNQYKNSVYHKLFESCHRLILVLSQMEESPVTYSLTSGYSRLKVLFSWMEISMEPLIDLLHCCQICGQFAGIAGKEKQMGKKEALEIYEKGWSYFISFALIHQYFLTMGRRKPQMLKQGKHFYALIERYILDRIEKEPSFRLAELMLKIYNQKGFDLKEITTLICEESGTLDFFVLKQQDIFNNESETTDDIIEHYSKSLHQWKMERYKNKIITGENQQFSISVG